MSSSTTPPHACGPACTHEHQRQGPQHIYVYSPSGAVRDKAAFKRGIARLRALGHEVEIDPSALQSHQRFAGDDATRLAAIERAARSGADVALIARGGYGLTRLLDQIDYRLLEHAVAQGTQFVGLSDFTALQLALLAQTGTTTWAGPALLGDLGRPDEPDDIMLACLDDLLAGQGEGAGWRCPKEKSLPEGQDIYVDDATLWGGNLAMLCALVGTPYLPPVQGGVLFLEDVAEHPYRIERMLTQLLYAGILGQQKVIVLGQFTDYQLSGHDKGFKLASVVDWLRSRLAVPVVCGLPFGHVPTKVLLPVGARVSLSVEGRDALIYWGHI